MFKSNVSKKLKSSDYDEPYRIWTAIMTTKLHLWFTVVVEFV